MSIVKWTDELLTGHAGVDQQHKNLFSMIEHLHHVVECNAPRDQLAQALEALGRYVITHFEDEEDLMRQSNYPGLDVHATEHRFLEQKTNQILNLFHQGKAVDLMELMEFTSVWIKNHVLVEDMKIVKWLKEKPWKEMLQSSIV